MDNLTIQNQLRSINGLNQVDGPPNMPTLKHLSIDEMAAADKTGETSFKDVLTDAIGKVNDLSVKADQAAEDLATGKSGNIHETLLAMQKADISFRMLLEVRTKMIKAYEEVMRMQV